MQVSDLICQLVLGAKTVDAPQFRREITDARCVDAFLVHAGRPKISNFLLNRRAARSLGRRCLHGLTQNSLIPEIQAAASIPVRLIWRDRIRRKPFTAGKLVEVLTWIERPVCLIGIEVLQFGGFAFVGGCAAGKTGAGRGSLRRPHLSRQNLSGQWDTQSHDECGCESGNG